MKFNLYPIEGLPAYKDYRNFIDFDKTNISMNNTILIVDCEMVMSSEGFELARVSIMNFEGENIYDKFFKPDK